MESFAPAYFDYMSSAVSANVCVFHHQNTGGLIFPLATDIACESLRLLQINLSKGWQRKRTRQIQVYADESLGYGEPLL
jgi:hypothetical protein